MQITTFGVMYQFGTFAFNMVRWWRKLGEVENECTSHIFGSFPIFLPKIIEICGNLTKFRQKQICLVFFGTRCIYNAFSLCLYAGYCPVDIKVASVRLRVRESVFQPLYFRNAQIHFNKLHYSYSVSGLHDSYDVFKVTRSPKEPRSQGQYWIEYLSSTNNSNYQNGRC